MTAAKLSETETSVQPVQLKKWMAKWRCTKKGSAVFVIIYDRYILAGLRRSNLAFT